jgi:uncharacterized protein YfaT (DUF1175 family)
MDMPTLEADLALAVTVLKLAVQLYQDVKQLAPFVEAIWQIAINKQALTDEQRQALNDAETAMRAQIDAAIAASAPDASTT